MATNCKDRQIDVRKNVLDFPVAVFIVFTKMSCKNRRRVGLARVASPQSLTGPSTSNKSFDPWGPCTC